MLTFTESLTNISLSMLSIESRVIRLFFDFMGHFILGLFLVEVAASDNRNNTKRWL